MPLPATLRIQLRTAPHIRALPNSTTRSFTAGSSGKHACQATAHVSAAFAQRRLLIGAGALGVSAVTAYSDDLTDLQFDAASAAGRLLKLLDAESAHSLGIGPRSTAWCRASVGRTRRACARSSGGAPSATPSVRCLCRGYDYPTLHYPTYCAARAAAGPAVPVHGRLGARLPQPRQCAAWVGVRITLPTIPYPKPA